MSCGWLRKVARLVFPLGKEPIVRQWGTGGQLASGRVGKSVS